MINIAVTAGFRPHGNCLEMRGLVGWRGERREQGRKEDLKEVTATQ